MDFLETLAERSAAYARDGFSADLKIIPSRKTMIVGCVDPRVDPMDIFQLEPGEAVVIRNVGGRVNPSLLETLTILATVARAAGQPLGDGWNVIVLQHTNCGIVGCYRHAPALLAPYMGVAESELATLAIDEPYEAVALDVAALRREARLPDGIAISGWVYDVATGTNEMTVPPERPPGA